MNIFHTFKDWFAKDIIESFLMFIEGEINFGQYRGKHYKDVNPGYLDWLLKTGEENLRTRKGGPLTNYYQQYGNEIKNYLQNPGDITQAKALPPQQQPMTPSNTGEMGIIGFGKHKGKHYKDFPKGYAQWLLQTADESTSGPLKDYVDAHRQELENIAGTIRPKKTSFKTKEQEQEQESPSQEPQELQSGELNEENLSDEQKTIDKKFESIIANPELSHMMIDAKAGSGKTTILNHLAWKYGKPGQKWLYVVFNTRNKTEAKIKFPPWVKAETSNSFLGNEVLGNKTNTTKIPQTERVVDITKGDADKKKLEKNRIVVDSKQFTQIMQKAGVPINMIADEDAQNFGFKDAGTINSIIRNIQYNFKESVLQLSQLAKAYAANPNKVEDLEAELENIIKNYDIDTNLDDVKERIAKYKAAKQSDIINALNEITGEDFMNKDFKDEVKAASGWLLHHSLPGKSEQEYLHTHTRGDRIYKKKYSMNQYRDFEDDLWYAAIHADELNWPHYDVVLADEVQDFNKAQQIFLKKMHESGAKIVAVGDPNQSIYRFRGADSKSFENIRQQLEALSHDKNVSYSLTKNYRSRPEVLRGVEKWTGVHMDPGKQFEHRPDWEGDFTFEDKKYDDTFNELAQEKTEGNLKGTAFISRTNQPLVHTALKLMANRIPFIILGKDIASDLNKHIAKIANLNRINENQNIHNLIQKMEDHLYKERSYHEGKSTSRAYLQDLQETTDALQAVAGQFLQEEKDYDKQTIKHFKGWIKERIGGLDINENERDLRKYQKAKESETPPVVLTTAHKSKGLEFPRVYILRHDLFPHPKAERPEDLEQEKNAKYVAASRGEDEVHVLDLEGQPGYKGAEE